MNSTNEMKCPRCRIILTEGPEGSGCRKCGYVHKPMGKVIKELEITHKNQISVSKNYRRQKKPSSY